jgi:hypothetical protein
LKYALLTFCGADATYDNTDVVKSLNTPESSDSMLTSSDFQVTMSTNSLYQTVQEAKPLSIGMRRNLKILTAFYHHVCRSSKEVSTLPAPNWRYNDFRTKEYDPNSQVVPWTVKLPGAVDR